MAATHTWQQSDRPAGFFKRIGDFFESIAMSVQYAKTMQALCNLSDDELAKLGITRSDIPQYAQKLVDEGL